MYHELIIIAHMLICIGLTGLVLIQHGKGADAGAAFGSGASATVFGSQGSGSFLTRTTAILATLFFITSLTLAYFSGQNLESESVVDKIQPQGTPEQVIPAPAAPISDLPPVAPSEPQNDASTTPAPSATQDASTTTVPVTIEEKPATEQQPAAKPPVQQE